MRQKLSHFWLMFNSRQRLLPSALMLHFASIVTFCGVVSTTGL